MEFEFIFKKLDELKQTEPAHFCSESEKREAEEISELRRIVSEIEDATDCTYYTST